MASLQPLRPAFLRSGPIDQLHPLSYQLCALGINRSGTGIGKEVQHQLTVGVGIINPNGKGIH